MEDAWTNLKKDVAFAQRVAGAGSDDSRAELVEAIEEVSRRCREERVLQKASEAPEDLSDEKIIKAARFTDEMPLAPFGKILSLTPRLVNVVTLAEAVPLPNSGVTLPLDLHFIASRCSNSYYAPRRFAAVQLAFSAPRARVLVFHTGRVVGTGCAGQMEARLSILRAQRQLAQEAGLQLHFRKFSVINQVAAVSLGARLSCDQFANAHSATSHYDRQSFVGLAWRPVGEPICCEIYSTGRANLPGSTRQRDLLKAWSRMAGQLLLHSDQPHLADLLDPELRDAHEPVPMPLPAPIAAPATPAIGKRKAAVAFDDLPPLCATSLWDGAVMRDENAPVFGCGDDDEGLLDDFI